MQRLDYDNMNPDEIAVTVHLDDGEKSLMDSIKNDEWVSIPNEKEEIARLRQMAIADRSRQKIEINLSLQDTNRIYDLAGHLGMSVSAVVQEVMHKYLGGELIEKT